MSVEVSQREDALVLAVHDVVDIARVGRVTERLEASEGAGMVILDVRAMTVAPADTAASLVDRVRPLAANTKPLRWAFVVGRLTARRILRELCADTNIGVHLSIDSALARPIPLEGAPPSAPAHPAPTLCSSNDAAPR